MGVQHRGALGARLDTLAIVRYFGGPEELAYALKKHALADLTPYAVKQWCTRRHIPVLRRLDLQTLANKLNKSDFKLENFKKKAAR